MIETPRQRYSDLSFDVRTNSLTGDLISLNTEESVKQSVRSLVLTNFYERPFQPFLGSQVTGSIFENVDPNTEIFLFNAVRDVIRFHEPRVKLIDVAVNVSDNERNTLRVAVTFLIKELSREITVDVFLKRVR